MEHLVRVSTYAQKNNWSTTHVYDLINAGKVECVIIDGVKFVKELQ